MGELKIITFLAGVVALVVALINIKDFFWFKKGVTLSLSESSTKSLFQRIRGLLQVSKLPSLILGTVALAIAANTYELICTSGFPMIYTRILTMRKLPTSVYYLYLLLYNVVYILPLVSIMLVFVYTLGRRKLQEHEGRLLKLMSGFMMLGLGLLLLLAPDLLHSAMVGGGILLLAVVLTLIIGWITREKTSPPIKLA